MKKPVSQILMAARFSLDSTGEAGHYFRGNAEFKRAYFEGHFAQSLLGLSLLDSDEEVTELVAILQAARTIFVNEDPMYKALPSEARAAWDQTLAEPS